VQEPWGHFLGAVTNASLAALHARPVAALSLRNHALFRSAKLALVTSGTILVHRIRIRFRLRLGVAVSLWPCSAIRFAPPPLYFRPPPTDRSVLFWIWPSATNVHFD